MPGSKRCLTTIATLLLAVACGPRPSVLESFDSVTWKDGESAEFSQEAPRLEMADRLIRSKELLGLSRSEVERLLGPSTETEKWRNWDFVYWLGAERGFISIDSEWLVIRVNEDGHVREAEIVKD